MYLVKCYIISDKGGITEIKIDRSAANQIIERFPYYPAYIAKNNGI